MWTAELYQKALRFAALAHGGQTLPGSKIPYVVHISNVTMEILLAGSVGPPFDLDLAMQCALLHDTLEDTPTGLEELRENFGEMVAQGVQALTKDEHLPKEERMLDSLRRIRLLPKEIWMVKMADRITNLQTPPATWSKPKCGRYREEAATILECLGAGHPHLTSRLTRKIADYATHC